MNTKYLHDKNISAWALRVGLLFVFLYAGVESLLHPLEWTGYLPHFLTNQFDAAILIKVFAVVELILAAGLLVGKYLKIVAAVSALLLFGIVLSNLGQLVTTFRDVGLALMAVALIFID